MEEINVMGNGLDIEHREWAKIVAQAWADPDFRQRLEKNPRAVLKERGVNIPANVNFNITDKPLALEDIERAIKPIDMAVAAGFAAPPMAAPQQNPVYTPPFNGADYYTGGYGYPSTDYAGAIDPTLEGKGKVGLCINTRATIGACAFYQWGAGQPYPQQPFPTQQPQAPMPPASYGPPQQQQPQAPMPAASYGPPQQQQPPTSAWAGDLYSSGSMDPTLEGKGKVGLCLNFKATLGACAFFQWGAGQPYPQQPFPTQQPQAPMPAASYGPPQQQQAPMPAASYGPPQQQQQPPTAAWAGDPYSSGAMDPTLEGKGKVGLCINVPVTGGVCAYVHWGTGQPFVAQPMPAASYASQPQQPPTAGAVQTLPYYGGDIYSSGAMDPTLEGKGKVGLCISSRVTAGVCAYVHWGAGQPFPAQQPMAQPPTPAASYAVPVQPQQPTAGWAATVPTQCFSGAAAPPFVPPGHPSQQQQFHIQPSPGPGPQTRPANPGSA
jgi:hypothetical protein